MHARLYILSKKLTHITTLPNDPIENAFKCRVSRARDNDESIALARLSLKALTGIRAVAHNCDRE